MTEDEIKQAAAKTIAYLQSDEGREAMRKAAQENEEFFEWLRKASKPSWESLHRPFDI